MRGLAAVLAPVFLDGAGLVALWWRGLLGGAASAGGGGAAGAGVWVEGPCSHGGGGGGFVDGEKRGNGGGAMADSGASLTLLRTSIW